MLLRVWVGDDLHVHFGGISGEQGCPYSSMCDAVIRKGHGGFARFGQKMHPVTNE